MSDAMIAEVSNDTETIPDALLEERQVLRLKITKQQREHEAIAKAFPYSHASNDIIPPGTMARLIVEANLELHSFQVREYLRKVVDSLQRIRTNMDDTSQKLAASYNHPDGFYEPDGMTGVIYYTVQKYLANWLLNNHDVDVLLEEFFLIAAYDFDSATAPEEKLRIFQRAFECFDPFNTRSFEIHEAGKIAIGPVFDCYSNNLMLPYLRRQLKTKLAQQLAELETSQNELRAWLQMKYDEWDA